MEYRNSPGEITVYPSNNVTRYELTKKLIEKLQGLNVAITKELKGIIKTLNGYTRK